MKKVNGMNLTELNYFIEVVDARNISIAAKKLYISQPNLSRSIRNLEKKMGHELLLRTPHGVEPTAAGKQFYYYARSIQQQVEMLERLKHLNDPKLVSRLHVSVALLLLKDDLMMKFFHQMNSLDLDLCLYETTPEEAIQQVIAMKSEFAIIVLLDEQLPMLEKLVEMHALHATILDQSDLYVHLHKDHPLANEDCVTFSQLLQYPHLHLPNDFFSVLKQPFPDELQDAAYHQRDLSVNNYHSLIHMLRNTGAYTYGNKWQIEELALCSICSPNIDEYSQKLNLILIKRDREDFSSSATLFLSIFKEAYGLW